MLPILFSIGPFHVYTYILFLVMAFIFGLFITWKRGREVHFDEVEWLEAVLGMLVAGIIAARIVYSVVHIPWLSLSWGGVGTIVSRMGFSAVGALIGALAYYAHLTKKKKWDFWTGLDVISPALALVLGIISLGNFVSGSGYGMPTTLFFGVYFSGLYDKRIPVQLFEGLWFGLLFAYVWNVEGKWRTFGWYKGTRSEAQSGFITGSFALFGGLGSLISTLLKSPGGMIGGIRIDIGLPILSIIAGLSILHVRSGLGLWGIGRYFLKEWGLTGGLVDNWRAKRGKQHFERLKLGDDIFS